MILTTHPKAPEITNKQKSSKTINLPKKLNNKKNPKESEQNCHSIERGTI